MFLGLRTQCVQCHDHPFNDEWRQADFWGINAFFRQTDAPSGRIGGMRRRNQMAGQLELVDNPSLNPEAVVYFERRNGVVLSTKPTFIDRTKMGDVTKDSTRRKELAKLAGQYAEKARVAVRNVRRDGMDALKTDEKKHEISEDERKRLEHEVQKLTDDTIKEIDEARDPQGETLISSRTRRKEYDGTGRLAAEIDSVLVRERLLAMLSSLFGFLALLLACIGLYGLFAFNVVRRRRDRLRRLDGGQRAAGGAGRDRRPRLRRRPRQDSRLLAHPDYRATAWPIRKPPRRTCL